MTICASGPSVDPLTRLSIRHGTDKFGPHFYTPLYHELFLGLRERPIRLLEIGVGGYDLKTAGGASLAMWADYFSCGEITGLDIAEKRLAPNPRIKLYQGSQDDSIVLKKICDERGPFDIVIDDGSHVPKHVVTSFNLLFPSLVDGGLYVIEDVQTAFWPHFGGSSLHGGDTVRLTRTLIECLNHAEIGVVDRSHSFPPFAKQIKSFRAFHNVFVIDKGENCEPSNAAYELNNPAAIDAVKIIEEELERAPTAAGMANLADVYLKGGNLVRAKDIADRALAQWPTDTSALMVAYSVANRRKDTAAKIGYLERMLHIEPENAVLRRTMEEARGELTRSGGGARS